MKFWRKKARPRRGRKVYIGLHDMTRRAKDILRNRVDDESAAHEAARDELEDAAAGRGTINRFAFQVEQRLTGARDAEDLTHHPRSGSCKTRSVP